MSPPLFSLSLCGYAAISSTPKASRWRAVVRPLVQSQPFETESLAALTISFGSHRVAAPPSLLFKTRVGMQRSYR